MINEEWSELKKILFTDSDYFNDFVEPIKETDWFCHKCMKEDCVEVVSSDGPYDEYDQEVRIGYCKDCFLLCYDWLIERYANRPKPNK